MVPQFSCHFYDILDNFPENSVIFIILVDHPEDLQNLTEVSRSSLIHHLRAKANHGKMNLEKDGKVLGRLKKVEITKFPIQQDRCFNGEVSRLSADNEDICGKLKFCQMRSF